MAGKTDSLNMAKGRLVSRSTTSTRPPDMTLNLDCTDEPLSNAQLLSRLKLKESYDRVMKSLDEMMKEHGAHQVAQSGLVRAFQYKLPSPPAPTNTKSNQLNINQGKNQQIKLNVLNNNNTPQGNIQLVMDPRMGVLLSTVSQQPSTTTPTVSTVPQKPMLVPPENSQQPRLLRRAKVVQVQQPEVVDDPPPQPPTLRHRNKPDNANQTSNASNVKLKSMSRTTGQTITKLVSRPTEQTSVGGIAIGVKNNSSAEVIDESKKNLPDNKEIAFNKMNGTRTFPSLVVIARPQLRVKDVLPQVASKERADLDMKVKSVLMYSATRFAEWLIQQGLVRSEQYCTQHGSGNIASKPKLKLAMYSDTGTFPYSGGYVWISNCCPDRYVSVFSGSIFQGAPHMPSVLLKLIYHWACQTNVQNVVSWVKVSNLYVKNFYTNLRSVCTAAVWDKCTLMGGKGCNVQVGVISLGTTSQDGNMRQVKVEVLGILNIETGQLRLRACDPIHDTRSCKRRFNNILYPLKDWVHKDSKISTDFTVDKATLHEMGFNNVFQSSFSEQNARNTRSNYQIMEYLRKIVPRMFQNTLSLLNRQMIQQFLDELVWREMFGLTCGRAFENIIAHIAELTRLRTTEPLLDRLTRIAANPFVDWSYSTDISQSDSATTITNTPSTKSIKETTEQTISAQSLQAISDSPLLTVKPKAAMNSKPGPKRKRKRHTAASSTKSPEPEAKRMIEDTSKSRDIYSNDRVPLNEVYYGTVDGDPLIIFKEDRRCVEFTCFLCNQVLNSNIEVMQHMINHVPPRVPGQTESYVCRYCCAAFSSQHQMTTHVDETHSTFGKSDGFMVVCGICENKFGNSYLLINHMSCVHMPSEVPYRCDTCNYRSSSHKDIIDHYYTVHDLGEYLQCPYCLKTMQYNVDSHASASNVHAYLVHMQRHVVRREQGRGNKCPRCCLWFNQKSALKRHQDFHQSYTENDIRPYVTIDKNILIPKSQHQVKRLMIRSPSPELPQDDNLKKWSHGPITMNTIPNTHLRCQECEEDIDEEDHYPGEQKCTQCRYVTCCWRAFKEHQQQIHNERPMTSLIVPSPLVNVMLDKKMQCLCGFATKDGNLLAQHLVKCKKMSARPMVNKESGMLDSLGLVPKGAL
ncbi:hypothetical protein PV328_009290 [Microctonus aethiopoides]|uniref:C2H2-type domain-containing protein n=1 Tax=Microctonus aethiopoides TaxID=144406 RepID=A0AA39EZ67_9HYME|nr:hypothetical protein PV328_009290 [Microctonus aethiopoides]